MNYFRCGGGRSTHTATKIDVAKTPLATFESNVSGLYIPEILAYFSATQAGTGDPSPSNPRPISGVDKVRVTNSPILPNEVTDIAPYNFRPSGGDTSISGRDRLQDTLVGGTVAFNQIIPNNSKDFSNSATDTRSNLYLYFMSITSPAQVYYYSSISTPTKLNILVKPSTVSDGIRIKHKGLSKDILIYNSTTQSLIANHVYYLSINITSVDPTTVSGIETKDFNLIDLTQMFGSTIADYIYSLEQGTEGAGVAWFRNLFPKSYYAYNAGGLMSVKTSKHITTGFNQWDEEVRNGYYDINNNGVFVANAKMIANKNPIKVFPSTTYYLKSTTYQVVLTYYDSDMNLISQTSAIRNTAFTPPSNCVYLNFSNSWNGGSAYNNDICINISNASKNGEYEPYVKHEYDYSGEREVTRYFGVYTCTGSENWTVVGSGTNLRVFVEGALPNKKATANGVCNRFVKGSANNVGEFDMELGYLSFNISSIATTKEEFNTWLQSHPTIIVYELATPYTETVSNPELRGIPKLDANNKLYYYGDTCSDLPNPQVVDEYGTEQYVDSRDIAIPIGHSTDYFKSGRVVIDINLGGTYYGGYVNVTTGVLTVTHGYVDLGSLVWQYNATYNRFYAPLETKEVGVTTKPNYLCDIYKTVERMTNASWSSSTDDLFITQINSTNIGIRDNSYSGDYTQLNTDLSGHYIVYELATPQTVQLTPAQIEQLLGQNNVFCSTGDVAVKYWKID